MKATDLKNLFLKARDPQKLYAWYEDNFDLQQDEHGVLSVSFQVDKLGPRLDSLAESGVTVADSISENEHGRFAWVFDPEGNKIELWEPVPYIEPLVDLPEPE